MNFLQNLRTKLRLEDDEPLDLKPGINILGGKKIRLSMRVRRNGVWTDVPDEVHDLNGARQ